VKNNDKNLNKKVDEKVEKTENVVKASASASSSFNFNFKEFLAKIFEAIQQNKDKEEENNKEKSNSKKAENNKEVEKNSQNEENPEKGVKFPFNYYFNVHARSSASASASSSSSFYYNYAKDNKYNEDEITGVRKEPQENVEVNNEDTNVEEKSENDEQSLDAENVKVKKHCN